MSKAKENDEGRELLLPLRLYLDADVHKKLAPALRLRGYDVVSAHEVGKSAATDREQLEFATSQKRAILTFNPADFVKLHTEYVLTGKPHCGIVVSNQVPLREGVQLTINLLNSIPESEAFNKLWWLQSFRVRRIA